MSRTTDNIEIDFNTYNTCVKILKKGLLSSKEIQTCLKQQKEMNDCILKLLYNIRKLANDNRKGVIKLLDEVIKKEHIKSLERYKKYRCCLTKEEHLNVLKEILAQLERSEESPRGWHTITEHLDYYKKDFEHFRRN